MDKDLKNMENDMKNCLYIFKEKMKRINENNNIKEIIKNLNILKKNKKIKITDISNIEKDENKNIIIKPFDIIDLKIIEEKIKKKYKNLKIINFKEYLKIIEENIITLEGRENMIKDIKNEKELSKIILRSIRKKENEKNKKDNKIKKKIQEITNLYTDELEKIFNEKINFLKK